MKKENHSLLWEHIRKAIMAYNSEIGKYGVPLTQQQAFDNFDTVSDVLIYSMAIQFYEIAKVILKDYDKDIKIFLEVTATAIKEQFKDIYLAYDTPQTEDYFKKWNQDRLDDFLTRNQNGN